MLTLKYYKKYKKNIKAYWFPAVTCSKTLILRYHGNMNNKKTDVTVDVAGGTFTKTVTVHRQVLLHCYTALTFLLLYVNNTIFFQSMNTLNDEVS